MQKEDLNFELNLLPVISMLAVVISFLLLTAVWIRVGTIDIRQASGEASDLSKETPTIVLDVMAGGNLSLSIKNKKSKFKNIKIGKGKDQASKLESTLAQIKVKHPEIRSAMVNPAAKSRYQRVITVLQSLKNQDIKDIGVTPVM